MKIKSITITVAGTVFALLLADRSAHAQNLFVGSYGGGNITEISGGTETVFDTGYGYPTGLAFDSSGDLFAADQFGGEIYEYSGGTKTTFESGLNNPNFLAYYGGDLYVNINGAAIDEFNSAGTLLKTITVGVTNAQGLAFDKSGDLYVANLNGGGTGAGSIIEISGGVTSVYASGLSYPVGIAFNNSGDLFVGGGNGVDTITEIAPGDIQTPFASGLNYPSAIAVDSAGDVWSADQGQDAESGDVTEFSPTGTTLDVITTISKPASLAFQPVPEPSDCALLGLGVAVLAVCSHKKKKKRGPERANFNGGRSSSFCPSKKSHHRFGLPGLGSSNPPLAPLSFKR